MTVEVLTSWGGIDKYYEVTMDNGKKIKLFATCESEAKLFAIKKEAEISCTE